MHHSTSDSDDLASSPYRCRAYVILLIILPKWAKGQSLPPAYPHVQYDNASGHFNYQTSGEDHLRHFFASIDSHLVFLGSVTPYLSTRGLDISRKVRLLDASRHLSNISDMKACLGGRGREAF